MGLRSTYQRCHLSGKEGVQISFCFGDSEQVGERIIDRLERCLLDALRGCPCIDCVRVLRIDYLEQRLHVE